MLGPVVRVYYAEAGKACREVPFCEGAHKHTRTHSLYITNLFVWCPLHAPCMPQSRSEHPSLLIYEALSAMLLGSGSPFQAQVDVQPVRTCAKAEARCMLLYKVVCLC